MLIVECGSKLSHIGYNVILYGSYFMKLKPLLIVTMFLPLFGCGTKEFRMEKNICEATWLKKIPPRLEQEMYNKVESRQVPTGYTSCYGYGNYASCNSSMRTEYYTVPAVRTVDRNQSRRNAEIKACTTKRCNKKYGNAKCE